MRVLWCAAACAALMGLGVACGDEDVEEALLPDTPPAQPPAAAPAPPATPEAAPALGCPLGPAEVSADGQRRLALLIGVGDYLSERVPDLQGPEADVAAMHRLLTDPVGGYGFPTQNVCVLTGEDATLEAVTAGFEAALTGRVGSPQDEVLFYFSGHGSQVFDRSGDEADSWDEALVLYDSRVGRTPDLLDDELNRLLTGLHAETPNITVVLDSCNSGSAARDLDGARARWLPAQGRSGARFEGGGAGDGGGWWSRDLPGVVFLSGARDGSAALEPAGGGMGFFTQALVDLLSPVSQEPLTWSQVAARAPTRVALLSGERQTPVFQGALDRFVFDAQARSRPLSYEVTGLGSPLELTGFALPGWGEGAVLRLYAGSAQRGETRDPRAAKASARVLSIQDDKVLAELISEREPLELGDLAVLAVPSPQAWRLPVEYAEGLSAAQREAVQAALAARPDLALSLQPGEGGGFTLAADATGRLMLLGPEGRARVVLPGDLDRQASEAVAALARFARQRALLGMRGEGGAGMSDDVTLELRARRSAYSYACAPPASRWPQACPNTEQRVPVCGTWELVVRNTHPSDSLWVGGAILWNNGDIEVFPSDGRAVEVPPGREVSPSDKVYDALPPVDLLDHVVVFGTSEGRAFNLLQLQGAVGVGAEAARSSDPQPLELLLEGLTAGAKSAPPADDVGTWTRSTLPLRVGYNLHLGDPEGGAGRCSADAERAADAQALDLTPYLPGDPDAALYKVLTAADELTRAPAGDEALAAGGPGALWSAFTRAGVPYNAGGALLDAAEMTEKGSAMAESFSSCLDEPALRTGDLLVYQGRAGEEAASYAVMLVDPLRRLAWGSHGWGSPAGPRSGPPAALGYQPLQGPEAWRAQGLSEVRLKACWRHEAFTPGPDPRDTLPVGKLRCDPQSCAVEVER